jgi:aminoglycoside N3'-acetyltransferase
MVSSNAHNLGMISAEDVIKLKKELRLKQAEFDKHQAILEQKNEQLESQLKETECRLQSQAQMYETMINSLKAHDTTSAS